MAGLTRRQTCVDENKGIQGCTPHRSVAQQFESKEYPIQRLKCKR